MFLFESLYYLSNSFYLYVKRWFMSSVGLSRYCMELWRKYSVGSSPRFMCYDTYHYGSKLRLVWISTIHEQFMGWRHLLCWLEFPLCMRLQFLVHMKDSILNIVLLKFNGFTAKHLFDSSYCPLFWPTFTKMEAKHLIITYCQLLHAIIHFDYNKHVANILWPLL